MNARAFRYERLAASARPRSADRGAPSPIPASLPSPREIDAFARASETRLRSPRCSLDDLVASGVATVGSLMSFVERSTAAASSDPDERKMARCLRVGDYDGALFAASVLAYRDPNHWEARRVKTLCARLSYARRAATRSSPRAVLTMVLEWDVLSGYPLTREQAYILCLIDGVSTVSEVIDASAFAPGVAERTLAGLLEAGLLVAHT